MKTATHFAAAAIAALAMASIAHAQTLTEAPDRVNQCRNGAFPGMAVSYEQARLRGDARLIADDRFDDAHRWDPNSCPSDDASLCRVSAAVKAGTTVLVANHYRGYACVFVPGRDDAGWVADNRLTPLPRPRPATAAWSGRWRNADDVITVTRGRDGALHVSGKAVWHGGHDNDHFGDVDFTARPVETRLISPPGDACRVELIQLGAYLIVRDNAGCGGVNVRFNGIYTHG